MLGLDLVERLRRRQWRQDYRRKLADHAGLRLLPRLRSLPLVCVAPDGSAGPLAEVLGDARRALLRGAPGSGRRLAFTQLTLDWLEQQRAFGPPPLPIDLARLDDGSASPLALLTALLRALDREGAPPDLAELGGWLILLGGWEELPRQRRIVWRAALESAAPPRGVAGLVVAAPQEERPWSGFLTLDMPQLGAAQITAWLGHLAGPEQAEALQVALAESGFDRRLFDLALALAVGARGTTVQTRAALYEQGLALYREESRARPAARPDDLPIGVANGLGPRQMRLLADVRRLVAEARLADLVARPPAERDELALLAAGMLDESGPLLRILRAYRRDDRVAVLAGACLAERAPRSPALTLLAVADLGRIAAEPSGLGQEARRLLERCLPALDQALAEAAARGTHRLVLRVLSALPEAHARPRIEWLAYDPATDARLAWRLADRLAGNRAVARGTPRTSAMPEPDRRGSGQESVQARRAYVQVLEGPEARAALFAAGAGDALRSLAALDPGRCAQAAAIVVEDRGLAPAIRLAALSLIERAAGSGGIALVERLTADPVREVRLAAYAALARRSRRRALAALVRPAFDQSAAEELRRDAVIALAGQRGRQVGRVLIRCACDPTLPLATRLAALQGLGGRLGMRGRLLKIAQDRAQHAVVRAAALALIVTRIPNGRRPQARPLHRVRYLWRRRLASLDQRTLPGAGPRRLRPALAELLASRDTPPVLAAAVCRALVKLGGAESCAILVRALEQANADPETTLAVVDALGELGGETSARALGELLGAGALARLKAACPPGLLRAPTAQALTDPAMPPALARRLAGADAACLTPADRPTTPSEFLTAEADTLRAAAARALARSVGETARAALVEALLAGESGSATPALVESLAELCGPHDATALAFLLGDPGVLPRTRWLVAQRLHTHPAAEPAMLAALGRPDLDSFTRGALAEGLGRRRCAAAHTALAALALDRMADSYLREQALAGLGLLGDTSSEALLLRLAADTSEQAVLRGCAAAQLGQLGLSISAETRRALRGLLRTDRPAPELVVGVLRAFGRVRDRESLPLLLQYSLDEHPEVVRAAIEALAVIGDSTVTPVLVNISQSPSADRVVRLQAIGALMRIGDGDHALLLRTYLDGASLPLQLQALEHLVAAGAPPARIAGLLAERERPLPFRLRALAVLAEQVRVAGPLAAILGDESEPADLRGRAASALAGIGGPAAFDALVAGAARYGDHAGVRLRCIEALEQRGDQEASLTLGRLAEAASEHPAVRERAAAALLRTSGLA